MSYIKYPRTPHLPDSAGVTTDDRIITTLDTLKSERIVVTEKMDGENTTLYSDYCHARSLNTMLHPSQSWMKHYWASKRASIPPDMRVCGENLYATHSIKYTKLKSYFLVFGIWQNGVCLSWPETLDRLAFMGMYPVPTLYTGLWTEDWEYLRQDINKPRTCCEGYVTRVERSFEAHEFPVCIAKYVRANHVQTTEHWRNRWSGEINAVA